MKQETWKIEIKTGDMENRNQNRRHETGEMKQETWKIEIKTDGMEDRNLNRRHGG